MRPAFTLIEMLVATAIAAMLMIAVLKVTASLGQTQRTLAADVSHAQPLGEALTWIERDLAMAESATIEQNELVIQTFNHIDAGSRSGARHRRSVVRYRLMPMHGNHEANLWVREQRDADNAGANTRLDVLASGIASLRLTTATGSNQTNVSGEPEAPILLIDIVSTDHATTQSEIPWTR